MSRQQIGVRQDILRIIASADAEEVTELMARIYYRLLLAPLEWWQDGETLCVRGKECEGVLTTAWSELVTWLNVSSEVAYKAIEWMREKEIITYRSYRKGREIRISFAGLYYPEDNQRWSSGFL